MELFNKSKENQKAKTPDEVDVMTDINMHMAFNFYESKNYGRAYDMFKLVAENTNNSQAQYNLGSMYAQGLGTKQNFVEAAYWFHKAYRNGEEGADKLTAKCLLDYANTVLRSVTVSVAYERLSEFAKRVYGDEDYRAVVRKNLLKLGTYYFNNKKEYALAAKLFRAGAEYENDAMCQNNLAILYNIGAGVEKSDLAALYWFDKAARQGVEAAQTDRDGIFNAYINNLGRQETAEQLRILVHWCTTGTNEAVPVDKAKANDWNNIIATL